MTLLGYIIIFTLLGSVISLIGGILLLIKEKFAIKISHFLSSFAAGTLLGTAFFDLLPEATESGGRKADILLWVLVGILIFFLLERFIHHHHQGTHPEDKKSIVPLIMVGDTLHNFIDGVAIAATFLISIPLGMVTTLAVAAHEIPQEIGDFGLLLNKGLRRRKVLQLNFVSALAAIIGALLTYLFRDSIGGFLPIVLALTAGFFIYIAVANLIPEIHANEDKNKAFFETILLISGVLMVWVVILLLGGNV